MKQVLLLLVMLSVTLGAVHAQEITVVTEEWGPYNYTEDGKVVGISTEIVQATLARAGIDAEIRIYPWARAYTMALEKENVLIFSIYRSRERESLFKWIGPISLPTDYYLFKLTTRTDLIIHSLEDAKKYTIGVMRDDQAHQFLLKQGFNEEEHLDIVSREELNIRKLIGGRIDFLPSAELSLADRMKKLNLPFSKVEKTFLLYGGEAKSYMAFSQQTSDELVDRVRAAFEELNAEGIIETTVEKYLKKDQ
ncbi:MAG: amino acid ABC transporter substrate-binding protein [bacterium]|nr:amino acid ABC transporter substrate-binding protein [bacterium]